MASSSIVPAFKHDVFLSFRGNDTRNNFTSHLYAALRRKGIIAYKDDEELERGDEISKALEKAIEVSKVSVIIFSKNYASSSWCLDELAHILECHEKYKQIVLPVFYFIDPSEVRQQKGTYESAFSTHEERFGNKKNKVQKWRGALRAAANLAGWDSRHIKPESNLVDMIVKAVVSKMDHVPLIDNFKGLVGLTKRTAQIESLLRIGSLVNIQKVGIWGIGGIGKTTLARVVFERLSYEFERCCFLANIREEWEKGQKDELKKRLFSELLEESNPNMGTLSVGSTYDKSRLCSKKVLIVLDDVDDSKQLDFLAENYNWFGPESRIIVTTRDIQVLREEVDEVYQVERLNDEEAALLFQSTAFKRKPPRKDLLHLSERVINYSEGIPLALQVLGSFLRGQKHENWGKVLDKLKECPHPEIQSVLRISYDGLDKKQKCIFLDIACFFKGVHRDYAERILDACGLFAKPGIDDLIDKSLVTIKDNSILWMHDLVQEMGWEIEQSIEELPRRCRLWNPEDVYHVLKNNIGTATIEGLVLDMSKIREVHFNPTAFQNMYKLRLLKIFCSNRLRKCEVCIPSPDDYDLKFLPDSLKYLHWDGYPWKSFPLSFRPQHLVELKLPHSKLHKLWEGNQVHLGSLKKIDLGYSKHLITLPDLSGASNLEHIYLEYCTSLEEVPSYFQHLHELKTLILEGCSSVRKFPKLSRSIVCLVLSGTSIEGVPLSIMHLSCLEILILDDCEKLKTIPNYILKIKSLKAVSFEGTTALSTLSSKYYPWWIERLCTPSQRSLFQQSYDDELTFCRHLRTKFIALAERPFFDYPENSIHMCVQIVLTSVGGLWCMLNPDHDLETAVSDSDEQLCVRSSVDKPLSHCGFYLSVKREGFLFYNCLRPYPGYWETSNIRKLKFLSRKIALQEFTSHGFHGFEAYNTIGICCPGIEIPKWFRYQFSQTSASDQMMKVQIELPPDSLNPTFLGFAVCASVDIDVIQSRSDPFSDELQAQEVEFLCKLQFPLRGRHFLRHLRFRKLFRFSKRLKEDCLTQRELTLNAAFEFSLLFPEKTSWSNGWRVKKCGIHLLYEEDASKFGLDCKALYEEEVE